MRQAKKLERNNTILERMDDAFWQMANSKPLIKSLSYFSQVCETKDYYILRCYGNYVACINKKDHVCYNAEMRLELFSEVVQDQVNLFKERYCATSEQVYKPYK